MIYSAAKLEAIYLEVGFHIKKSNKKNKPQRQEKERDRDPQRDRE
jgi:hypothetical protein